jgi:hypothetical protein
VDIGEEVARDEGRRYDLDVEVRLEAHEEALVEGYDAVVAVTVDGAAIVGSCVFGALT